MNLDSLITFDLKGYITEYVATKLLDVATTGFNNALKRINSNRRILKLEKFAKDDCIEYIYQHIQDNIRWATNISFRDASKSKFLSDIFIELDLFITPLKLRVDAKEKIPIISFKDILSNTEKNIVLLGQPGAGKTTSVKKLFLELIMRKHKDFEVFSFPLVIKLKELSYNKSDNGLILFKEILNTLGIFYSFEGTVDEFEQEKILIHIFKDFIERLDVLIILDGFDEIGDMSARTEIVNNLRLITNSLMNSKFILTSRSADYNLHIDNSSEYEICPLNETQITDFISRWINDESKSNALLSQLKTSPYWDTMMRPLTLAHLCALYERNNSIPDKPKSVYKKIIQLLLEDWSNQRSIVRVSRYSKFEVDRKMDFLSRLAFELTVEYGMSSFNRKILEQIYNSICLDFELPQGESNHVVNEIESHNGLIMQIGSDAFEFAHKSLLEYLVSDYLVKLPFLIRDHETLLKIPNELAISVGISSKPNVIYFEVICTILGKHAVDDSFLMPFLSRLLIEKPDFEPNVLFALTNIYLSNIIAEKIFNLEKKALHDDDYLLDINDENFETSKANNKEYPKPPKEAKSYYLECLEILFSYRQNEVFKKSIQAVKRLYRVGEIDLGKKSSKGILKNWGKIYHLKQLRQSWKVQSFSLDLPDNLLWAEESSKKNKLTQN